MMSNISGWWIHTEGMGLEGYGSRYGSDEETDY